MSKVGIIKTKLLKKLTESYGSKNKSEIKDIIKTVLENKKFKEMYLFYEEIENKYIEDKETAKLYIEGLENMISSQSTINEIADFCKKLDKKLGNISSDSNELYESLDQLFSKDTLSNDELVVKTTELKEGINNKIEGLLVESNDKEMNEKLNRVKQEVNTKEISRLNYFRLIELKNGLD